MSNALQSNLTESQDVIDGNIKLNDYLKIKLSECELQIKKHKAKHKKLKIIYYSFVTISVLGSTTSLIISTLSCIPLFVITILAGASTVSSALSYKFNLEDKKSKLNNKIVELSKIKNYIQYINALNGDLTQDKIDEILQNV